jgi:arginine:ornithine antiporter / lysine permease
MKDLLVGLVALGYAIWLLYAGGLKYLLLSALLYAPGVILFALAKREQGQPLFTHRGKRHFQRRDRGRRVSRVWAV